MNLLNNALSTLNNWLKKQKLSLELVIIGGYALYLKKISTRITYDIDTLVKIPIGPIRDKIDDIGNELGIDWWLNDQASGLILPENFYDRLEELSLFSNIKIYVPSREDLISLKIAASFYRRGTESKDFSDLKDIKPTLKEFEKGLDFLKTRHAPDSQKFAKNFLLMVEEHQQFLTKFLYEK